MRTHSRRAGYLDPATGSYVLQMVVAGVLAAFYAFRGFLSQLLSGGKPVSEDDETEGDPGSDEPAPDDSDEGSQPRS